MRNDLIDLLSDFLAEFTGGYALERHPGKALRKIRGIILLNLSHLLFFPCCHFPCARALRVSTGGIFRGL